MLNLTVDDTSTASLSYGPGWGIASSDDAALSHYFQSTYHASETPGALVNLTFEGLGIYLYGSKGPDRGNFSVRYDSNIQLLSAHANEPKYQQLLFKATFASDAKPHTLTLNNTSDGKGATWVDLDYLTITSRDSSSQTQGLSSTISPLPVPSRGFSSDGSQSSSTAGSQASPKGSSTTSTISSASNDTTLILAIVFGVLLFLLIFGVAVYLFMRRRSSHKQPPSLSSSSITHAGRSAGSAFIDGPRSPSSSYHQFSVTSPPARSTPTNSNANVQTNFHAVAPFRELEPEPEMHETTIGSVSGHGSTGHARPWSPLTSPIKALFGGMKEGTESMKSTFLKV